MGKTVRFAELVKAAGKPYVATLWTNPKNDRHFTRAVRENRVLTIRQPVGSHKKDFGVVGFHEEKNASYFVFPKRLRAHPETQVVGIKYNLLVPEPVADPVTRKTVAPSKRSRRRDGDGVSQPPIRIEETEYTAIVRRTACWERVITVRAHNKTEARQKLGTEANSQIYDIHDAIVRDQIRNIRSSR